MKKNKNCTLKEVFDTLYTGEQSSVTETLSFDDPDIERGIECPSTTFSSITTASYYYYYYYIRKKGLHFECGGICREQQNDYPDSEGRPTLPTFSETQKALRLFARGNWLVIVPNNDYYIKDIVIETCDNTPLTASYVSIPVYASIEEGFFDTLSGDSPWEVYLNNKKQLEIHFPQNENRKTGVHGSLRLLSPIVIDKPFHSFLIKSLKITLEYTGKPYYYYDSTIDNLYPFTDILEEEVTGEYNDKYIGELFKKIYLLFTNWNIFSYNKDDDDSLRTEWDKWLSTFLGVFVLTKERYETLLEVYEQEQDSLLSQLKTSRSISNKGVSENRLNDTPQVQDDGTIEGDDYLTQYQKGNSSQKQKETSSFDPMTAMARLTEIGNQYRKVWSDWVDEFKTLFYPSQLYDYRGADEDDD